MQEVTRKTPLGVKIIAICEIIGAIVSLLAFFFALATGFASLGSFLVVDAIIKLIMAWGLWTLKRWAYWVTVILEAVSIIFNLFTLLTGQHAAGQSGSGVGSLVVSFIVLVYLFADKNVRAAFRQ
jgi:uncharacterized membrane protein (DUF2068 family)